MILGVGVDLCRIERIRRSVEHFGKSWLNEVFTDDEQQRLGRDEQVAHRAAIGFALKEACSKAIGSGIACGVRRQDFDVHLVNEECNVVLTGAAKRLADRLSRSRTDLRLHTQFDCTKVWISALAVLECGPTREFSANHPASMLTSSLPDVVAELEVLSRRKG